MPSFPTPLTRAPSTLGATSHAAMECPAAGAVLPTGAIATIFWEAVKPPPFVAPAAARELKDAEYSNLTEAREPFGRVRKLGLVLGLAHGAESTRCVSALAHARFLHGGNRGGTGCRLPGWGRWKLGRRFDGRLAKCWRRGCLGGGRARDGGGDPQDSGFIEGDALPPLPDVVETDSWCAPDTESSVDQVSCCNDQPCRGRCYATEDGGVECRCYQLAGGCQQQGLVCCPLYGACTTALSCEHYP